MKYPGRESQNIYSRKKKYFQNISHVDRGDYSVAREGGSQNVGNLTRVYWVHSPFPVLFCLPAPQLMSLCNYRFELFQDKTAAHWRRR